MPSLLPITLLTPIWSDTPSLATAICPHPKLSLMPVWLGPYTSFLD